MASAETWLDGLLTRRVVALRVGHVRYSLVCKESGGVLDDVLVTRVAPERFELVVNASNRTKLIDWFATHADDGAELTDRTERTAMFAVQGPGATQAVATLADRDVDSLAYYTAGEAQVAGVPCEVSRTGYTGEDGFELTAPADGAETLWQALVAQRGVPCGLAARDTLRLEAGMPLYGHELSEDLNPIHAGLGFAVSMKHADGSPREFVGRDAIVAAKSDGALAKRVGLLVEGRRAPREQYRVLAGERPCGVVTSGTHSPTLDRPIAMAYVEPELAADGTRLAVDVRGTQTPAVVTPLPFYRRR